MNVDWSFKKIFRDFQIRNSTHRRLRASQINPLKKVVPIKGSRGIAGSIPTRGWLTPSSRQDSSDKKISILFRVTYFTPLSWTSPKPHKKPLAWKKVTCSVQKVLQNRQEDDLEAGAFSNPQQPLKFTLSNFGGSRNTLYAAIKQQNSIRHT